MLDHQILSGLRSRTMKTTRPASAGDVDDWVGLVADEDSGLITDERMKVLLANAALVDRCCWQCGDLPVLVSAASDNDL